MTDTTEERCPHCDMPLFYELGGQQLTSKVGHAFRGVYDGVLFWGCLSCHGTWHRFPDDHRLHEVAQQIMDGAPK